MNDEGPDEPIPRHIIEPLMLWMVQHNVLQVRVIASPLPSRADQPPSRDDSANLLYCDEAPTSEGLLDVYVVADEHGRGRLNGPSNVPQAVLRPLLRALDDASVSELLIASSDAGDAAAQLELPRSATITAVAPGDIEEHEVPAADNWPPSFLSVQAVNGDAGV